MHSEVTYKKKFFESKRRPLLLIPMFLSCNKKSKKINIYPVKKHAYTCTNTYTHKHIYKHTNRIVNFIEFFDKQS